MLERRGVKWRDCANRPARGYIPTPDFTVLDNHSCSGPFALAHSNRRSVRGGFGVVEGSSMDRENVKEATDALTER